MSRDCPGASVALPSGQLTGADKTLGVGVQQRLGAPKSQGFLGGCALGEHVCDAVASGVAGTRPFEGSVHTARPHSRPREVDTASRHGFSPQFSDGTGVSELHRVFHLPGAPEHLPPAEPDDGGEAQPCPRTAAPSRAAAFLAPFTVLRVCGGAAARFGQRFSPSPLRVCTPGFRADSTRPLGKSSCAGGGPGRTRPGLGWPSQPCRRESSLVSGSLAPSGQAAFGFWGRPLPRHKARQKAKARGPCTQGETQPPGGCAGRGRPRVCSA